MTADDTEPMGAGGLPGDAPDVEGAAAMNSDHRDAVSEPNPDENIRYAAVCAGPATVPLGSAGYRSRPIVASNCCGRKLIPVA